MIKKPKHPGKIFKEEILQQLNLNIAEAASMLGVNRKALYKFVNEETSLSPQMALRVGKATKTDPEIWMNMQIKLSLWNARKREPKNVKEFPLK